MIPIKKSVPSGLLCLEYIANKFDKTVEIGYLQHRIGESLFELDGVNLCRCARWIGLKAKMVCSTLEQLSITPLPAIIYIQGSYYVLISISSIELVPYCPRKRNTEVYTVSQISQLWDGTIYLFAEGELKSSDIEFGFSWFLPSIVKHYRQAKKILFLSLLIQLIALATPIIFENVVDRVLVSRSVSSLHVLGVALLIMAIFEPLLSYMRSWLYSNLASKLSSELSARLYSHLISLPLNYFNSKQAGQIIARVREIDQIRQFLSGSALTMILDLIFIGIFLAVMFFYTPLLTWVVIGSLLLYFIFWVVIGPILRSRVNNEFEKSANNTAFLTESITGIETVKTNTLELGFEKQWESRLASQLKSGFKARVTSIFAQQGIDVIQKLTAALTLWWGVQMVMRGDLSSGELVAFNMLAGQVTQPILRLAQVWQDYQHTLISLRRVGEILDEPQEAGSQGMASIPEIKGEVIFNQVRFQYDADSPEVLKNISLVIKAGEFVGITGRSGSGKSTLTKLLQRLYTPTSGQIFIDGLDLAIADPVGLRRNMSVVLQDSRLFSGTIAENIRQCVPSATDEEVVKASKLAGAHDFITTLPAGYATPVGENGSRLSGGQKQRIALARALITDPKILILDEATSALDYESEAKIISRLPEIAKGRTVISIAHRLNSLTNCDRVINLHDGHVSV